MKELKTYLTAKKILIGALLIFFINAGALLANVVNSEVYHNSNIVLEYAGFISFLFYYPFGYLVKEFALIQKFPLLESIPILLLAFNSLFYSVVILTTYSYLKSFKRH